MALMPSYEKRLGYNRLIRCSLQLFHYVIMASKLRGVVTRHTEEQASVRESAPN
jgi:hypothetical protein